MQKEQIKVGLLIESYDLSNWACKMVEEISNSSYARIVVAIKKESKGPQNSFSKKLWQNKNYLLYNLYRKFDRKFFKSTPDAFKRKNIKTIYKGPYIEVPVRETKYCDWIFEDGLKEIAVFEPEVLIRLGFRILKGDIFNIPKYGIWSFHHGDNNVNRGGPPGFWEVMNGIPETGVVLQILGKHLDGGAILYKSYSLTDKVSVHRNTNRLYWKALSFIPRRLQDLYEKGEKEFFENIKTQNSGLQFYSKNLYKPPTNISMFFLLGKLTLRIIIERLKSMWYFEQWIIQFKFDSSNDVSNVLYKFKEIVPPKDRIWADPQIIIRDDRYFIFIEEMLLKSPKAWISVMEIDEDGTYTKPVKVLEEDTHLSYPYVFKVKEDIFMIPENKKNRIVGLYKCRNFPLEWEFVKILFTGIQAVDPTILQYNGKYWLFMNVVGNEGASAHDELRLYYTDDLLHGEWSAHPLNPIVSDVKKARPAGKPFRYNGHLYRPSQNCSHHYGYGLKFNRIDTLNIEEYKETTVSSIEPEWNPRIKGIHTFNTEGKLTVTDALLRRKRFF